MSTYNSVQRLLRPARVMHFAKQEERAAERLLEGLDSRSSGRTADKLRGNDKKGGKRT